MKIRRLGNSGHSDAGFTLFELLIVITILPLVVGAISVALLAVFNNESSTTDSLTASSDAQVSSATFVQDVQSAAWITQDAFIKCAPSSGSYVPIISFSEQNVQNTVSSPITDIVSYDETLNSDGSTYTLVREACSSSNFASPTSSTVVSHNALSSTSLNLSPSSIQGSGSGQTGSGWVAAASATNVDLQVNEPKTSPSAASPSSFQSYSLNAVPRTTANDGASPSGTSPILPLTLIGQCPTAALSLGSSHGLTVDGGSGPVGTTETSCPSGMVPNLSSAYPYITGVETPFSNVSAPATPATSGPPGSCSAATMTCTSGWYTTGTTGFSDSLTGYTIDPTTGPDPGVVVFEDAFSPSGVTFLGGSSQSGDTYSFEQGATFSGTDLFGSATYIFSTPSAGGNLLTIADHATLNPTGDASGTGGGGGGLLFYFSAYAAGTTTNPTNGTITTGNGFSSTGFYSPPTGQYDGIVWWDASCGGWVFDQGVGHGSGPDFNGGIYAPCTVMSEKSSISYSATFVVIYGLNTNSATGIISG